MNVRILTAIFLLMVIFSSCRKEEDGKNSHRITEILFDYDEGTDRKAVFSYEDSKLISVVHSTKNDFGVWEEYYKAEMLYFSGTSVNTYSRKESTGSWYVVGKSEYIVQDGLILEETSFDYDNFSWELNWQRKYQYSGSDLISYQRYYPNEYGTLVMEGKGDYLFNNGTLTDYLSQYLNESGTWITSYKETFIYTDGKLTSWTGYNADGTLWDRSIRVDYSYDGDQVSRIEYIDWDDTGNRWESMPYYALDYTYDKNGYLIESLDDNDNLYTYTYEEGHGNASYFWYYPSSSVYNYPRLKSTGDPEETQGLPFHKMIRLP